MFNKIILPSCIALTLAISACTPTTRTATPSVLPSLSPAAIPSMATFAPALPPPFPQIQAVNGLEVELLNARILDGQLTIDICHQMPTQEDWIVGSNPEGTFVTIDGKKTSLSGFGILYYRTSYKGGNSHRCDALTFDAPDPDPGKITLTIDEFYTSVPEVPDCEAAQKKLDEAGTGITFTCDAGAGYFNYTITQKPETMSDNDARMIVFDSFSSHATGPWVFEINMPVPLVVTTSTPWLIKASVAAASLAESDQLKVQPTIVSASGLVDCAPRSNALIKVTVQPMGKAATKPSLLDLVIIPAAAPMM